MENTTCKLCATALLAAVMSKWSKWHLRQEIAIRIATSPFHLPDVPARMGHGIAWLNSKWSSWTTGRSKGATNINVYIRTYCYLLLLIVTYCYLFLLIVTYCYLLWHEFVWFDLRISITMFHMNSTWAESKMLWLFLDQLRPLLSRSPESLLPRRFYNWCPTSFLATCVCLGLPLLQDLSRNL